ncbi:DinB family protein [Virgibacillus kekensis]|uniref:DinB family protein n=1 Tax=Virgibacillus kekensis TaxID=202261 RepID=A0ABV9DM58_9BACI
MSVYDKYESAIDTVVQLKEVPDAVLTEPIAPGKWSIKEIVGHMFYWDKFILERMVPDMKKGKTLIPFPDHDTYNAEATGYIDKFNPMEVMDVFAETRKKLSGELQAIDSTERFTIVNEPGDFSPEKLVAIFVEHDEHHFRQIEDKLEHDGI